MSNYALAIALILASIAVLVIGPDSVELVGDSFQISVEFPTPALPQKFG